MSKDVLIKDPLTPYGANTMKIKYLEAGIGAGGGIVFLFLFVLILLPFAFPYALIFLSGVNISIQDFGAPWEIILSFLPPLFIISVFAFLFGKRLKSANDKKQAIIEKGDTVIGKITRVVEYSIGSRKGIFYAFVIDYKHPVSGANISFQTPALDRCPFIKAEDLPIEVKLYVSGEEAYADEIINPPIDKMLSRKRVQAFWTGLAMVGFLLSCLLLMMGQTLFGIISFALALLAIAIVGLKNNKA